MTSHSSCQETAAQPVLQGSVVSATVIPELYDGQLYHGPECVPEIFPEVCADNLVNLHSKGEAELVFDESYALQNSIWDAGLLTFFHFAEAEISGLPWHRFTLICSILLNISLQVVFIMVIWFNMLDHPYDIDTLSQLAQWRIDAGNNMESVNMGRTFVQQLCNENEQVRWSFEQSEYDKIHNYTSNVMPGQLLSGIALVLWVFRCMEEWRSVVDQFRAILALYATNSSKTGTVRKIAESREVQLRIEGASLLQTVITISVLILPRLGVLISLCGVGCMYLTRIPDLADIILNAMALSFVLDIDEMIYDVLLSRRMQQVVEKIEPIGTPPRCTIFGGPSVDDIIRVLVLICIMVISIFLGLLPFADSIWAADLAVCGGIRDFSWHQDAASNPVTFVGHTGVSECSSDVEDAYLGLRYGLGSNVSNISMQSSQTIASAITEALRERRDQTILRYAFSTLEEWPQDLERALAQLSVAPGHPDQKITDCPSFDASFGQAGCTLSQDNVTADACVWTDAAYYCEGGDWSNSHSMQAACPSSTCSADELCNDPDCDQVKSSDVWWEISGHDNPFRPSCYYGDDSCQRPPSCPGSPSNHVGDPNDNEPRRLPDADKSVYDRVHTAEAALAAMSAEFTKMHAKMNSELAVLRAEIAALRS